MEKEKMLEKERRYMVEKEKKIVEIGKNLLRRRRNLAE